MKKIFYSLSAAVFLSAVVSCSSTSDTVADSFSARRELICGKRSGVVAIIDSYSNYGDVFNNFYYLTGMADKESVLVFDTKNGGKGYVFTDVENPTVGENLEVMELSKLNQFIAELSKSSTFALSSMRADEFKSSRLSNIENVVSLDSLIFDMRVIKDSVEIAYLRHAAKATGLGISNMMKQIKIGDTEKEMKRLMLEGFSAAGCDSISFEQAAAGENSTSVHAGVTDYKLADGDMTVVDIGAVSDRYTADISRSFPANGKFTEAQKEIYSIVLYAMEEGAKLIKPGNVFGNTQKYSEELMIDELAKLGLITDKDSEWQRKFYIRHGFSHHIGLDIHDIWSWYVTSQPKENLKYKSGMVVTYEPGLYFPSNDMKELSEKMKGKVDAKELAAFIKKVEPIYNKYRGIGVRIENDYLITENGNELITADNPTSIAEIEMLMQ
ncbi:MAG: M24 family metallopeptidase [Rikenellaceae bacterium]